MSKQLRIWLFAFIGTLLASSSLLAEGVITMTTSKAVGEKIKLRVEANGNVTIEGAQEMSGGADSAGRKSYRLKSQTITIRGDVTVLNCSWNQLTSLNVSKNVALIKLDCSYNQLTSLDVSKNTALTKLDCFYNQLTSLDVSKNIALTELSCYGNQLTSLDVSKNTALTKLKCSASQLTSLDVSKNTALTELNCSHNQLTSLNVSSCTALTEFWCPYNQLTSLDVSKNTALTELNCYNNKLTNLNISGCARLTVIKCYSNYINGQAMTKLVNSLPNRREKSSGTIFIVDHYSEKKDKNSCSAADVTTAKKKNWEVLKYERSDCELLWRWRE